MDSIYLWLKFLHVAAIVVWVGGTLALVILNMRASGSGDMAQTATMGQLSEFFGRAWIGPAMVVALLAGLGAAGSIGYSFSSLWIVWGIIGLILSVAIGAVAVGRTAGELGEVARTASPTDPRVGALRGRLIALNVVNLLILASVVWAMVFKPTL
jgi:putative membrane protein